MTKELPYRPCVGVMLLNAAGNVWIGRRPGAADDPEGRGSWWQMPQGGIDEAEDPKAAALRELMEETSVTSARIIAESRDWYRYDLPEALRPKAWGGRYQGQKQKWFLARFEGNDAEIVLEKPGHKPEFDLWRWANLDELVPLIVPFKRDVYVQVVEEFRTLVAPA